MATTSVENDRLQQALQACVIPLRQLARYQLEPPLVQRLEAMGERKEFLSPEEHAELIALVQFAQRRQVEKLQAEVALERLRAACPDLVESQ
jgi:delta 1-pyrroline-5-carboxylate dehydrogenase